MVCVPVCQYALVCDERRLEKLNGKLSLWYLPVFGGRTQFTCAGLLWPDGGVSRDTSVKWFVRLARSAQADMLSFHPAILTTLNNTTSRNSLESVAHSRVKHTLAWSKGCTLYRKYMYAYSSHISYTTTSTTLAINLRPLTGYLNTAAHKKKTSMPSTSLAKGSPHSSCC